MTRTRWCTLALAMVVAIPAHAQDPAPEGPPCPVSCFVARAREKLARGDAAGARAELKTAYALTPEPALLFALGQVELQLGNPQAAIDYYERFLATNPPPDDAALAQQAIGAARMQMTQPEPAPAPVRRYEHRWAREDTGLVVLGGVAIAIGGGLLYHAHVRGNDHTGTLAEYDDRLASARTERIVGIGLATAGAIAIGAAVLHWRLATVEVVARPIAGGVALQVGRAW